MNNKEINNIIDNITKDENLCIVRDLLETQGKKCCNKEMIYLGFQEMLGERDCELWICGDCGGIKYEIADLYDDEELWNLIEGYERELKDTKIFKKLKKEFE